MPIYAYKCGSCGHAKDVLQKISDAPLTECPACGKPNFSKQLTAAGFQLKGSGWYATDFKGSNAPASETGTETPASADTTVGTSDNPSSAVTSAPSGGCATGCACH